MLRRQYTIPSSLVLALAAVAALVLLLNGGRASAATGNIRVNPATQTVAALNTNFNVTLTQNADVATTGAQASFTFDATKLQIQSIALGSAYAGGQLATGNTIANANTTGTLSGIGAFVAPPATVPTGDQEFVVITMVNRTCAKSNLTLSTLEMLDASGGSVPTTGTNGNVISVNALDFFPLPLDGVSDWIPVQGDADCDGYPDPTGFQPPVTVRASETRITTNPAVRCPSTATANDEAVDAWPPDNNDSQVVNGSDFLKYNPAFGASSTNGNPNWTVRLDLNGNNVINGGDILQLNPFFGKHCV